MNPFIRDNLRYVLRNKKILLGITGSIAAFKACDVIRFLRDCEAQVRVVLTQGGANFITKTTLETLSGFPVVDGFWENEGSSRSSGTHHIETARWADLLLVAPATANFLAKAAWGFADDLLSTEILAFRGPVLLAPGMNPTMFAHPAVQENVERLKRNGTQILGPEIGKTSCGEEGEGRMMEAEQIVQEVAHSLHRFKRNKTVVITLGPTKSAIDPVRFMSNRSSGLMGACLAWAAHQEGYTVKAIAGTRNVHLPKHAEVTYVQTAQQMADASFSAWRNADLFIGAAAVLDWEIRNPAHEKLKKDQGPPQLEFQKSPDILTLICQEKRPHQRILGFAAETGNPIPQATGKLHQKGCDAIFANDVSHPHQGFESDFNGGWWISRNNPALAISSCRKIELARILISMIQNLSPEKKTGDMR